MLKLIAALMFSASLAFAADVTGTWQLAVETSQGTGTPTVVLKQDGEKLAGTFNSTVFGEAKLTGTVKGNAIEFAFDGDAGGQTLHVTYKGTVKGTVDGAAMKGTAVYVGFDDNVKWTATKK